MGFWKKVGLHFATKGIGSQFHGANVASEVLKDLEVKNPAARMAGFAAGVAAGSIVGGFRLISPISILNTALSSEEELEAKLDKMDWESTM